MAIMSQRAYARHRGCAISTVQEAIATNRIQTLPDGQIDSDVADGEWARNTRQAVPPGSPGASRTTTRRLRRFAVHQGARRAGALPGAAGQDRVRRAVAKLVPKDEVQVAAFNKFRQFRDHILNIPDRVAAMLAAETEAAKCYEVLATEIRRALNEFADSNG